MDTPRKFLQLTFDLKSLVVSIPLFEKHDEWYWKEAKIPAGKPIPELTTDQLKELVKVGIYEDADFREQACNKGLGQIGQPTMEIVED
jgi:hypothetical protein